MNPLVYGESNRPVEEPVISLASVDIVVLIVYVIAVVGLGCFFVRKSSKPSEFMAAGGKLPGWAVGMSIFGTYLSSNTFLGNPGKAFGSNFNSYVFTLTLPIAAWLATRYFVPFYRASGEISAYSHLEKRFGLWARTYAMVCYVLMQIARMGSIMFGVALGLSALTGWDITAIIVCTGVLVTLYTLLGGIEAVIWTDVVQSIVLMIGALVIFGLLLFGTPEGPGQSIGLAYEAGKMSLGSWRPDFTTSTVWVVFLFGLFINLTNFGVDQSFVQRYHTADSESAAKRSVWVGVMFYVPISLLFFLIGSSLFSFYQTHPQLHQEIKRSVAEAEWVDVPPEVRETKINEFVQNMEPKDYGDKVLPHFIATQLPTGMAGLLIAAIFAAGMSSVDTSLNSSATVVLKDIYQRYVSPEIDDQAAMRVLRVSTVAIGLIGTAVALAMIGQKSILDAWWKLQGIFSGCMLGLFLLGIAARRATGSIALISVMLGVIVIGWMTFFPVIEDQPSFLRNPLHANMIIVVGTLTIFLVGAAISALSSSKRQP